MKIAGKTTNWKGQIVNVYECEYCKGRSRNREDIEAHNCKPWFDSMTSDPELQCPICNRVGMNFVDEDKWFVCKCGHSIKEAE